MTFGVVDAVVDGRRWHLLIEQEENPNMSITNASEAVFAEIAKSDARSAEDRYFEAYEERMLKHGKVDPEVSEIVPTGGLWLAVNEADRAKLAPLFDAWIAYGG